MKRIAVLGSTGSIGRNTLEVIKNFPDKFCVTALSTNSDIACLEKQIKLFCPKFVSVNDEKAALRLKARVAGSVKILSGEEGLSYLCGLSEVDEVVLAVSGIAALAPLLAAIDSAKNVAMANKEALVAAGALVMPKAKSRGVRIIPIDSEQSAVWQCLDAEDAEKLKNIYLTASGGPFLRASRERMKKISLPSVLRHPRWRMGKKITVDSATLMNKGLEVIEAMFLFGVSPEKIKVLIHPEAIIHSMVEFIDGVVMAQLSVTDMRVPIQYAISYPERLPNRMQGIDFYRLKELHFHKPDTKRFPCLRLAYEAARKLGTMPCVLNAANEISVGEFLRGRLDFLDIPRVIERVINRHRNKTTPDLEDIRQADSWARQEAGIVIKRMGVRSIG